MMDIESYRWVLENLMAAAEYDGHIDMLEDLKEDLDICTDVTYKAYYSNTVSVLIYGWLVCMFGDYGIAPRAGWIEDIDGCSEFIAFLLSLLKEGDQD